MIMQDGDDDGQIRFRVVCKRWRRTRGGKDDSDRCETTVKVEPRHMQEFGITAGDVVRISGYTRSTAAICLPMADSEMRETDEPEVEVEFLDNPGRKAHRYPRIILSRQVSRNVDVQAGWQSTVYLSRFPKLEDGTGVPEAETVTLGTLDVAEKMMPGYRSSLDYSGVAGFVVTRDDLIDIPFQKEWAEKMQQNLQEGWEADEPANTGNTRRVRHHTPQFPGSFQSVVTDVRPRGRPFWVITKNTKFKFKNGGLERLFKRHVPAPRKLIGVIPLSRWILIENTEIVMASLELYPDTIKMIWYSHQRTKIPESDFTDMQKMNRVNQAMRKHEPSPVFSLEDNLGNRYASVGSGGGGGSTWPDPATMEIVADSSWHHVFAPGLAADASEIILTVKDVWWTKQSMTTELLSSAVDHPRAEPEYSPPPKIVIAGGPWRFAIPVSRQDV